MDRRRYEPEDPAPHGVKRSAEDSGLPEQRLTKRMGLLTIDRNLRKDEAVSPKDRKIREVPDEYMALENTKDKVYIYDLDAELSESEDEHQIFIPDIERKFMKIPQSILTPSTIDEEADSHKKMVLYKVPTSLTVSQDQDSVRKAIIETRQRAREQSVQDAAALHNSHAQASHGPATTNGDIQDAMEVE